MIWGSSPSAESRQAHSWLVSDSSTWGFYGPVGPGVLSLYAGFFLTASGWAELRSGGNDLGQLLRTHSQDPRRGLVYLPVHSPRRNRLFRPPLDYTQLFLVL